MFSSIKCIFCPVDADFETPENLFLPFALAKDFQARIIFCYCAGKSSAAINNSNRQKLCGLIEKVSGNFKSSVDEKQIEPELSFFETDDIAECIVVESARVKADLIVMRSSRQRVAKPLALGTISAKISRCAPCPVLFASPENGLEKVHFKRILAAHDFSDFSELALQNALVFSEKYHSEIHLVHVLDKPLRDEFELAWAEEMTEYIYHQTVKRLQVAAGKLYGKIITVVRWGKPFREILRYADEMDADLIAMGAHGTDFGAKSLFGSNADRVLRQSACAVLLARPLKPTASDDCNKD